MIRVILMATLVIVLGVAGAGKSTIGKEIAKRLHFLYLDKDTLTEPFVEALNPRKHDRESIYYLNKIRPIEYKVLLDVAEENLRLGQSVVLSAPFGKEALDPNWLERELECTRGLQVRLKIIWVKVDTTTERLRLAKRKAARDQWKLNHWEQYQAQRGEFAVKWSRDPAVYFEFDNRAPNEPLFEKQLRRLLAWINESD